jgi:7-alpha-hydroxysteroid dehydrogenase
MGILDKLKLDGKVIIMTGAGRGLGREMALALADAGADIIAAARTQSQIDETATMVRVKGRRCLAVSTDVTSASSVNALVEATIAEFGRIDVLVNNAGGASSGWNKPVEAITDAQWRNGIDLNITSAFYCLLSCGSTTHAAPGRR